MARMKSVSLLAGALSLVCLGSASAQTMGQAGPQGAAEIAAWADGTYGGAVQAGRINGAVVAVVRDGAPVFARGYGYADADRTRAVSVEDTTFRLGSVSKTFTALLVAQLQAQGRLRDLDAPIESALPDGLLQGPYAERLTFPLRVM
jgi:CubicO group peptidase (beta-lactamase class C family)